ncbi:MAG: hypothetical protein HOW97_03660 [Catenulispora sp.]|nr:hypothetical protein [Catenulispora sp.]
MATTPDSHGEVHAVEIDYVDTIRFDGRDYIATSTVVPSATAGRAVGHVLCSINSHPHVDPSYRLQDGDATYVAAGSDIVAVSGYDVAKAVAALHDDGVLYLYQVSATR